MIHENVDKDPDLKKASDFKSARRSPGVRAALALVLTLIFIGVVIVLVYWQEAWGPNQWGNVGTWVAGGATVAAVVVAVWQTRNANEQARAAEKRSDKDIETRRIADLRAREYAATSTIMKSVSSMITEVYTYNDSGYNNVPIIAMFQRDDSYLQQISHKNELRRQYNEGVINIRLALLQIESRPLYQAGAQVISTAMDLRKVIFPDDGEINSEDAVELTETLNTANLSFQKIAEYRFRHPTELPADELPVSFGNLDEIADEPTLFDAARKQDTPLIEDAGTTETTPGAQTQATGGVNNPAFPE
ncbi:hypothetical protein ACU5JM_08440 [Rhodococcus erythropolis]|uniref:hypothetical protein n=1 Tax=Rhodococcus erythropolis TaxID=1833 RepID=UPI00406B9EEC